MPPQSAAGEATLQASATESDDMAPAALVDFRGRLEPYGRWVDDPTYGTVWIPSPDAVGPDFVPYATGGHWALGTDDQWVWVSDYSWGATPFHYGRWIFIDGTGWAWIPGRVHAPAWVVWRTGVDDEPYVGWGPMPPAWYWRGGVAVRAAEPAAVRYVFVKSRDAFQRNVAAHVVPADRAEKVAPQTQPFVAPAGGVRYGALAQARAPSPAVARVPAAAVPTDRVPSAPPASASATTRERAAQRQAAAASSAPATARNRTPQQQPEAPRSAGAAPTMKDRQAQQQSTAARPAQPGAPRSTGAGVEGTQTVRPAPPQPKEAQPAPAGEQLNLRR
jgi:hypothetical protein